MIDKTNENANANGDVASARRLRIFMTGPLRFGIFENEIATIADWREPAPLPNAPSSILGVVSIEGRMLTLLDLSQLLHNDNLTGKQQDGSLCRQILALRGDEQLALAVDETGETIDISEQDHTNKSEKVGLVFSIFKYGETEISILNTKELFPKAIQGRERRRRRF